MKITINKPTEFDAVYLKVDAGVRYWEDARVNGIKEVIEDKEEEDTQDISILTPNNDGTYSYIMQFYNGGTCLNEMLEDSIKNLKED